MLELLPPNDDARLARDLAAYRALRARLIALALPIDTAEREARFWVTISSRSWGDASPSDSEIAEAADHFASDFFKSQYCTERTAH